MRDVLVKIFSRISFKNIDILKNVRENLVLTVFPEFLHIIREPSDKTLGKNC